MLYSKDITEAIRKVTPAGYTVYFGVPVETNRGILPSAICVPSADDELKEAIREVAYSYESEDHETRTIAVYNNNHLLTKEEFNWEEIN